MGREVPAGHVASSAVSRHSVTQAGEQRARPAVRRGALLFPGVAMGEEDAAVVVKEPPTPAGTQQAPWCPHGSLWERGSGNTHTSQRLILSRRSAAATCELAPPFAKNLPVTRRACRSLGVTSVGTRE